MTTVMNAGLAVVFRLILAAQLAYLSATLYFRVRDPAYPVVGLLKLV